MATKTKSKTPKPKFEILSRASALALLRSGPNERNSININQLLGAFFDEGHTLVIRKRNGVWEGGHLPPGKQMSVASYGNGTQVVANAVARCVVSRRRARAS